MAISDTLISVVIPALNEARYLPGAITTTFSRAEAPTRVEVIVADSGSKDGSKDTALRHKAIWVEGHPPADSRARAMNLGVKNSVGKVVLFLHADVKLPKRYDQLIREAMHDPQVVGGAFEFSFEHISVGLWVTEKLNRLRYKIGKTYYGDQCIFVRKEVFERMGGYPDLELMEDAAFSQALAREGRVVLIPKSVRVSIRRFRNEGVWRMLFKDLRIWWRDVRGKDVQEFAEEYRRDNVTRGEATSPSS